VRDRIVALIAAAGRGTRMGGSAQHKKQYHMLGDRPVLAHTIAIFEESPLVDEIVIVVCPEDIDHCRREVVDKYGFQKVSQLVPGGEQRADSVYQGLLALDPDPDFVLVHDGVRPFFPSALIGEVVQAVRTYQAAVVAVPVKDTIKIADVAGFVKKTPERRSLWAVQTPQAFSYPLLLEAYREGRQRKLQVTDDAMLVEALGYRVKLVLGTYENIKITTPEDFVLAEALLAKGVSK
jgi:2-C-methyl-D-erythritol 4-phosphate cytidylyltransferase